jgi:hypothetical protein
MTNHDALCPPAVKIGGSENCLYCILIMKAREQERASMANVPNAELIMQAYGRGREDAAVAVREFPAHSIPFLPSDTPLSVAVRVKDIVAIAAIGSPSKAADDQ